MKYLIHILIALMLMSNVSAICIKPRSGDFIGTDTIFCEGEYYINKEITILSDVVVDCSHATIIGDETNIGFLIENSENIFIKNCELKNHMIGVKIHNVNNIDTELIKNFRLSLSFCVIDGIDRLAPGIFTPFLDDRIPPLITLQIISRRTSADRSRKLPVPLKLAPRQPFSADWAGEWKAAYGLCS